MKKSPSHGDAALEGPLGDALKARLASLPSKAPEDACLDAETLAAWSDDGLDARARAAAEAHAADCSRCQALIAAMIRTTPLAAEAKSWWRVPAMRWLLPLTAATTALAVWAIVPSRPTVQSGNQVVPAVSDTSGAPASSVDRQSELQSVAQPQRDDRKQPGALDANRTPPMAAKALSPALTDAGTARTAASPSAAGTAPPQGAAEAPPPAAAPMAAQESFARTVLRKEAAAIDIVSADPSSRWRIVPGGAVRRSTDSGSTWETQQTGISVTLVAGASPSPSVCWLIGPGGIVLLQTDGRTWRRIAFPELTDLASIRAGDEKTATITTVDGRTFSTTDGGLTWTRSPRV